jgi:signal transduction histidine kinase
MGDEPQRAPAWGPPWVRGEGPGRRPGRILLSFAAVALLFVQLGGSTAAAAHQPQARPLDALSYLLLALGPLALLVLARSRIATAGVAVGAAAVYLGLGYPRGPVVASAGLSLVLAVAFGARVGAWVIGLCAVALALLVGQLSDHPVGPTTALAYAAWVVVLLLLGELPRRRAEQFAAARRARAAEREAAVGEERLELARDLHDTIGHSLSLIAVQAGVALHLLDEHPEQARPALTAIRDASKEALEEVRTVLAVLRADGDVPRAPAPTLRRADELRDQARAGGLAVTSDPDSLQDSASGLPPNVDAAAYRVVQEALTNVVRHAQATRAAVTVRRGPGQLEVVVQDDGIARGVGPQGRGLLGMRERARALGGSVQAGPLPGRGFRVAVRFPVDTAPVEEGEPG